MLKINNKKIFFKNTLGYNNKHSINKARQEQQYTTIQIIDNNSNNIM